MKSNVRIGRHPLHPYLVLLPVGPWVAALVFDIAYLNTRNTFWHDAAYWSILFGVIAGVLAAVIGATDLFTLPMRREARNTGWTHGLMNISVLILFGINLWLRARTQGADTGSALTWSFLLTVAPVGIILISGWLGGELTYRWGVAVPEETIERIPPEAHGARGRAMPGIAGARGGERRGEDEEQR